jgi:hypothetical protein
MPGFEVDKGGGLQVAIADAEISENGGQTTATITRSGTSGELIVSLDVSHQDELSVPDFVTIADGQTTSEPFAIVAVDDALLDGSQSVTITAAAAGYAAGSSVVEVTDDEPTGPPWQNAADPFDVDGQDGATAVDVLLLRLYLNSNPGDPSLPPSTASPPPYYDVDGDGFCTATDLLGVIIQINSNASGGGEAEQAGASDSGACTIDCVSGTDVSGTQDLGATGILTAPETFVPVFAQSIVTPSGSVPVSPASTQIPHSLGLSTGEDTAMMEVRREFAAMRFRSEEWMGFSSHGEFVHVDTSRWPALPGHWREYARARGRFWETVDGSDVLEELLVDAITDTV